MEKGKYKIFQVGKEKIISTSRDKIIQYAKEREISKIEYKMSTDNLDDIGDNYKKI
ncbi:MAG: hypothetical protein ACOCRX_03430 [Candidatus Woesearchaeota archaeon]